MARNLKIVGVCGLLAGWAWFLWSPGTGSLPTDEPARADAIAGSEAPQAAERVDAAEGVRREKVEAPRVPAVAEPTTGTLLVRVLYDDDTPAEIGIICHESGRLGPPRPGRSARTDAEGYARIHELRPGTTVVWTDHDFGKNERVEIVAGRESAVVLRLAGGIDASGVVVDRADVPIPGASIVLAGWGGSYPRVVARCDEHGRFHLRQIPRMGNVGARAKGFTPSPLKSITAGAGAKIEDVRIVLPASGGAVEGRVHGPEGEVVSDAEVRLGQPPQPGRVIRLPDGAQGHAAPQTVVRTDAEGQFLAEGLPPGSCPVQVLTPTCTPWEGVVEVVAHMRTPLVVNLTAGVTVVGTVRDEKGEPVPGVEVGHGEHSSFGRRATRTDTDGTYRLAGIASGSITVKVDGRELGAEEREVQGRAGETVTCDLTLDRGTVLRGIVRDEAGEPIARARIDASAKGRSRWFCSASTDAAGAFALTGCPEGPVIRITVDKSAYETLRKWDVDAGASSRPLALTMRYLGEPTARIVGTVLDPDGKPVAAAQVSYSVAGEASSLVTTTSATGAIEIGNLTPGHFAVSVQADALARWRVTDLVLASGQTTDLGVIRLVRGGTVQATLPADPGKEIGPIYLGLRDSEGGWVANLDTRKKPCLSEPVAPGRYVLQVSGPSIVPHEHAVLVEEGEVTGVSVAVRRGRPVSLRFVLPDGTDRVRRMDFTVTGADGYRTSRELRRWAPFPFRREFGLPIGEYTVRATTAGGHQGEAILSIREVAGKPIASTVTLR